MAVFWVVCLCVGCLGGEWVLIIAVLSQTTTAIDILIFLLEFHLSCF